MPSTRNGWSSSSYEKSNVGNRVERYLIKQPSDESLRQRLAVSMESGDSRHIMGECRFSYIHFLLGRRPAEAKCMSQRRAYHAQPCQGW